MATLQEIVNKAFREVGITAVGASPETAEYSEGLALLQSIGKTLIGNEMGERLTDVNIGSASSLNSAGKTLDASSDITSLYIPSNVRLVCNLTKSLTAYLNPRPSDGARFGLLDASNNFSTFPVIVGGNGRGIGSAGNSSSSFNTNGLSTTYIYRADLGYWSAADFVTDTGPSPFPDKFDDLLVFMVAKRLCPRFGATWTPEQEQNLTRMIRIFRAQYHQETEADPEYALVRLPSNQYSENIFGTSSTKFDKGLI